MRNHPRRWRRPSLLISLRGRFVGFPSSTAAAGLLMDVPLTWTADGDATSYRIEVGTTSGATDYFLQDVGNVTAYTLLQVPPGTYYWVVRTMIAGVPDLATAEQSFFV